MIVENLKKTAKQPMWWVALTIATIITTALIWHWPSVSHSWQLSWHDTEAGVFAGIMTTFGIILAPAVWLIVVLSALFGKW